MIFSARVEKNEVLEVSTTERGSRQFDTKRAKSIFCTPAGLVIQERDNIMSCPELYKISDFDFLGAILAAEVRTIISTYE